MGTPHDAERHQWYSIRSITIPARTRLLWCVLVYLAVLSAHFLLIDRFPGGGRVEAARAGMTLTPVADADVDGERSTAGTDDQSMLFQQGIPAFPGAEGWGALALNDCPRDNIEVHKVTTLNDSGAGSLREAVSNAADDQLDIVTFEVGGIIELEPAGGGLLGSGIRTSTNCLYIAGQTAPGSGITITAPDFVAFALRRDDPDVPVRDIVIRDLRIRPGTNNPGENTASHAVIIAHANNIVLDRLSMGWTNDQVISIYKYPWAADTDGIRNITVQRSILSEPFAVSPVCAISVHGDRGPDDDGVPHFYRARNVTYHHNLFAHCGWRTPQTNGLNAEIVNNVVYNWGQGAMMTFRKSHADYVKNYFREGPMTPLGANYGYEFSHDFRFNAPDPSELDNYRLIGEDWPTHDGRLGPSIYLSGNVGPNLQAGDQWSMTSKYKNNEEEPDTTYLGTVVYPAVGLMPIEVNGQQMRRMARDPQSEIPVQEQSAADAWHSIVEDGDVGANVRLTCDGHWVANQDAVDERVLDDARNGTGPTAGNLLTQPSDVGGYPVQDPGTPCDDTDQDGIPNAWEIRQCGTATCVQADAVTASGYLMIEHYLNGSDPASADATLTAVADAYVRGGSDAATNFGTATNLVVKTSSEANTRWTYLKFDLSGVSAVGAATLRLFARVTESEVIDTSVFAVADTSWSETGITWNNKPSLGGTALDTVSVEGSALQWYELDVTSYIQNELAADRTTISLGLRNPSTSSEAVTARSRENANPPELVLTGVTLGTH